MHHALGDTLAGKPLQLLNQLHVLQQHRAIGPGGLRVLVVTDHSAIVTGECVTLGRHGQQADSQQGHQLLRAQEEHAKAGQHIKLQK